MPGIGGHDHKTFKLSEGFNSILCMDCCKDGLKIAPPIDRFIPHAYTRPHRGFTDHDATFVRVGISIQP